MGKINVGIVGAGGYGGCGAIEILCRHPHVTIGALMAVHDIGKPISSLYPHLTGFCDLPVLPTDDPSIPEHFDVVFFATPDGVGQQQAGRWLDNGAKIVDYSGDFRFDSTEVYRGYAERIGRNPEHAAPQLLSRTVYGLTELHREQLVGADLVGNPGCFAVSCILGLAPAVAENLVEPGTIICDAKSGVSGAGKSPKPTFHYPARYECMNAYKIAGHQHVYEIERELSRVAGREITVTFTPHVVPLSRGILSTIYAQVKQEIDIKDLVDAYRSFYEGETFVRVFGPGTTLMSTDVRGSNYCNISVNYDGRTGKMIVVSLIDNLMKGQAGSAVQNMNVLFGFDEAKGLNHPGFFP
jgi:N-acetyl-gamma-glutamyl-phosphate reductase